MASADANTSFHGIAARLDRIPISGFHKKVMWLLAGLTFCDSVDMGVGGPIGMVLQDQGFMTLEQFAFFNSITMVGYLIGGLLAGAISDGIGRRKAVLVCGSLFTVFCFVAAASPDANFLTGCRFFMGVGLVPRSRRAIRALTEFTPPQKRGKYPVLRRASSPTCGYALFASVMNLIILPDRRLAARCSFSAGVLGAVVMVLCFFYLIESPRWLAPHGPQRGSWQDRVEPREQDRLQGRGASASPRRRDRAPRACRERDAAAVEVPLHQEDGSPARSRPCSSASS